jgi:hypothetical protein
MNHMKGSRRVCAVWALGVITFLVPAPAAFAQSTTDGAIGGLVSDQSKASVPGASVTVRNVATNAAAESTSDASGRFVVIHLQPGVYTVAVSLAGFSPYKRDNVIVEVGRTTNLDVTLGIAGQSETIEVIAESPVINLEQSDFSTNINQTTIANLPTNTRRWSTFALMTPGAAPDGNFGLVSFRGISGLLNSNTVDGGDNTQAFFAEERGRTRLAYSVSADAVREFQVTTSNYSAEYGRAAGGVVNAVTKSGTNNLHGSGFYFIRDNKWGATNPFQTQTVLRDGVNTTVQLKPKDRRQQFGGTVGGPIAKDKVFFFFSYDQQARNFPGVAAPTNPSSFFAPFTAAEQTTFASRGISTAQQAQGLAFLQGLTGVVPRTGDQTLFLPKIDWKVNNNHSVAVTYNRLRWDSPAGVQTAAVVNRGIESWGNDGVDDDWITARLTSVLGSRMTNEVRFQWGRDFEFQSSQPPIEGEPVSASGRTPAVDISGTGGISFGKPNFLERRAYPDERRIDVGDTFTLSSGSHLIKIGGDISRVSDVLDSLFQEGGVYAYSNRTDFITDFATRSSASPTRTYNSFSQGVGPTAFSFRTFDYDAFVQDTWHVNQRTTLNLGLRYDYEKMPDPQIPNSLLPATSIFPVDKNNFGPRIGVVYDLSGNGSTVVRGGYGMFYGRIINSTISNAITNVGSASGQLSLTLQNNSVGAPTFPNILPSASATPVRPDVVVFKEDAQNPLVHEYDLIFEQRIAANTGVSLSYVGSAGRHLPLFIDTNLPAPSGTVTYAASGGGPFDGQSVTVPFFTGARPNPNFSRITTISDVVESRYNGFVAQLNRRMNRGLQVQASYTEARVTDNGQSSQTFTSSNNVLNPFDLSLEDGTSNFEIRHRFGANAIWTPSVGPDGTMMHAVFSGFTIAPAFVTSSGVPYTATLTGNTPNTARVLTGVLGAGGSNRLPSIPRNAYQLPRTMNFDLRVSRGFDLGSGHRVEALLDIFNVTNRLNHTSVNSLMYTVGGTVAAPTLTYNPTFGSLTNANSNYFVFTPRQVQLAVRYTF